MTTNRNITANTTWAKVGNPHQVTTYLNVSAGATLTIEPGVQVNFAKNAGLLVQGTLTAIGTAAEPILFTGSTPEAGWWTGIEFKGSQSSPLSSSALEHVTVEYGGANGYGALYLEHATVPVKQAAIRHSSQDGVYAWYGGVAHLSDVTLSGNARHAAQFVDGSVNPRLARLTVSGNGVDAIALGSGTMAGEHLWENAGAPYLVAYNHTNGGWTTPLRAFT